MIPVQLGDDPQKRKVPAGRRGASHETKNTISGYHALGTEQGKTMESFNSIVAMLVRQMTVNRRGSLL